MRVTLFFDYNVHFVLSFAGGFGDKTNYGGFEANPPRTNDEHRKYAMKAHEQENEAAKARIEKEHGCRYTELLRLPYFDCVRMSIIDPMHNLFEGTAKFMLKDVWVNDTTLGKEKLDEIQDLINKAITPSEIGTIPYKLSSYCASLKANELQNWTLYFSPFCLFGKLSEAKFSCWMKFVEACRHICKPVVTANELSKGHENFMKFCREFEALYGSERVTPNMHLHQHLTNCIMDYASVYSIWLYSFERYNGIMGMFHSNHRSVELQLMRKFLNSQNRSLIDSDALSIYHEEFSNFVHGDKQAAVDKFIQHVGTTATNKRIFELSNSDIISGHLDYDCSSLNLLGPGVPGCLEEPFVGWLVTALDTFLSTDTVKLDKGSVSGAFNRYSAVDVYGTKYGSEQSRLDRSSYIIASWCDDEGNIIEGHHPRPGRVEYYMHMFVKMSNGEIVPVILARVSWYQKHYAWDMFKNKSFTVWTKDLYEVTGPSIFMPVQRVQTKFVSGFINVQREPVRVVIPQLPHYFW